MHKPLLFILLFLLASAAALRAQACNFDQLMREGKVFLDKKKPEYRRALYKFNAARTCDPNQSATVDKEVDRLFGMIEGERDKVVVALAETERARLRADNALLLAETEKKKALAAKEIAEAAEKKATAVLDKIYFYEDRYGLAYDKKTRLYGFINQQLDTLIAFKYSKPSYFTEEGFAIVVEAGTDTIDTFDPETYEEKVVYLKFPNEKGRLLLIDTLGREFRVATDFHQLSDEITAFDLRGNELTEIPNTIGEYLQLKILLLSQNLLTGLPAKIGELKSLQSLYLNGNQLQTLPEQIGELKSLQSLYLDGNQLQTLPEQIGELKSLQSLYLSNNQLDSLPTQIGELKSLQLLNLYMNRLQTLPTQIGELKSLQLLNLYGNKLDTLPAQIGELKSLQSLNLSGNRLEALPVQIGELKNLQSLYLYGNKLDTLPAQIGELKSLQSLDLSVNQLQTLPEQISELKSLKSLSLPNNQLDSLPTQIGELKSLQLLDLSGNQLQSLPAQIGELKSLQSLYLSGNKLQTLPAQIGELKSLQSLSLNKNKLQTLPAQIGELKSLQSLSLSGNKLQTLPIEVFGKMPNLKKIVLASENGINLIPETTVLALRTAMPWCEIEWQPQAYVEKKSLRSEAFFEKKTTNTLFQEDLADTYNSLGWLQLLAGQFAEAEASINHGFELDSTHIFLPLIRASSLLFQGKTEAAKQDYEKWKDLPFGENGWPFYRDAFLGWLEIFEKANIIPEARKADVEAVRKLLGVKK